MAIIHIPARRAAAHPREPPAPRTRTVTLASVGLFPGELPRGYGYLADNPEVVAVVHRIADLVAGLPIHLMENGEHGDTRVRDGLSRLVDVRPWRLGTRQSWVGWIVRTLLLEGDGNAYALPISDGGFVRELLPMPDAVAADDGAGSYTVSWHGQRFTPDEVLHFRLWPDSRRPWAGTGVRLLAQQLADALARTRETQSNVLSNDYKPPVIVSVSADSGLDDAAAREALISRYITPNKPGQPWVIPGELLKVETAKPVSLTDLAIKDGLELDKRTAAAIFGAPAYMTGAGAFSRDEYNYDFLPGIVRTVYTAIQQELTAKLLISPTRFFRFSTRSLYAWSLKDLSDVADAQYIRGLMTGNECRDWLGLGPLEGLDELVLLENYIPLDKLGDQKKLIQDGSGEEAPNAGTET